MCGVISKVSLIEKPLATEWQFDVREWETKDSMDNTVYKSNANKCLKWVTRIDLQ